MTTHAILRRFIRESLVQQGDVPGRWRANEVEPVSSDDKERLGNGGWLDGDDEGDDDGIAEVRRFVRCFLLENPAGASVTADPTDIKGFYPWEMERGTDIHAFWYKSPGRPMGTEGDPGRPEDAKAYVGQTPPEDNTVDAPGEEALEDDSAGVMPTDMPEKDDESELEPV